MKRMAAIVAMLAGGAVASAQPGDRNAIVYGARAAGETQWRFGYLALFSPDTSPLTFEVGVFFFRNDGVGFATAVHKTYLDGVVNDGATGSVAIVEDPSNGVPASGVDGRVGVYNLGAQAQAVFSNRGGDVGGSGCRISSATDSADAGAPGGISVRQAGPVGNANFHTGDGELGYRFDVTVSAPAGGGARHLLVWTPMSRVNAFAVFAPDGHQDAVELSTLYLHLESIDLTASWVFCPADVNADGFVDGMDYDQFSTAYEAGDIGADFNGDGFVDGIDYDRFMNHFAEGC